MQDLKPHQRTALTQMKNGSILWGGVGAGKSAVAAAYYVKHETPKNIVVITTAKKRDSLDWEKEFAHYAIGKEEDASISGILTVDSWNNIKKYADRFGCFFIFDEQRLVGSGAWVKAFLRITQRNNWILLSATPGDNWLDYIPVFIANGFYKNRTQFKREHVVYKTYVKFPKVDHYMNVSKLVRLRNQILVQMPYERETIRHQKNVFVDFDEEKMLLAVKKRWNMFEDRPIRDVTELFAVMRRIANEDLSRVKALRELLNKHPKIVVFYNFNYELDRLREVADVVSGGEQMDLFQQEDTKIAVAEWNGHKHEPIPNTDSWVYLVQYAAGAEGWNCIETDTMVFYSLTYSYKMWEQAHGRIDRLNTPFTDLWYYVFRSKSTIDHVIWRALKSKKNFNEKGFDVKLLG